MEIKEKVVIPEREYNQLIKFSNDGEFLALLDELREILRGLKNQKPTIKYRADAVRRIRLFLVEKRLPLAWREPVYNMVVGKFQLDFPLDNSISLKVGSQEITGSTKDILLIKNIRTGDLVGEEPTISLEITSKVSAEKIIKFVKKHKREIEHWQDILGLPDYKSPIWKNINLALKIIRLKDKKGLTFGEISSKLSDDEGLSQQEVDYLATEDNIKTLYYRFKSFLNR